MQPSSLYIGQFRPCKSVCESLLARFRVISAFSYEANLFTMMITCPVACYVKFAHEPTLRVLQLHHEKKS